MPAVNVLDDLSSRGLIHDTTDVDELRQLLDEPVTLYHGIDPTADSLHVGNFVGVLVMRRFQEAGHRPLALVGGATGMVGDPSGRSDERNLLDEDTLAANVAAIRTQLGRFLDFERGAELVDNRTWTAPLSMLEFLRDVGKHVTVNQMTAKESIRARMQSEDGISYTEFSYLLLQANDYWWLHENRGCRLQIGGSDQWGNITAGIDLIRRRSGATVHGLTWPLLTKADGSKFGKSAGDNVWLSAERTSPYRFYQHWMQTDDRDVERFLLQLTLLPVSEVREIVAAHAAAPHERGAQATLASALTTLVHGPEATASAREATAVLFGSEARDISAAAFEAVAGEVPTSVLPHQAITGDGALVEVLVSSGLSSSKSDARRGLDEGSIYVNNRRRREDRLDPDADLRHGRFLLLRRGKRSYHLIVAA